MHENHKHVLSRRYLFSLYPCMYALKTILYRFVFYCTSKYLIVWMLYSLIEQIILLQYSSACRNCMDIVCTHWHFHNYLEPKWTKIVILYIVNNKQQKLVDCFASKMRNTFQNVHFQTWSPLQPGLDLPLVSASEIVMWLPCGRDGFDLAANYF